tara:strand:+ start:9524 stop:9658 length:135 start_codon:yes stop_codon:yes gene_type:complete
VAHLFLHPLVADVEQLFLHRQPKVLLLLTHRQLPQLLLKVVALP